ncbi:hypothetical protein CSV74_07505 [Sporosarcina sp. P19]|uniref:RCC1 domain-containing protein n=1 Tax=Sporosarcina sp. P19 TaxID=2048258 RepID=UPI000C1727A4|nr:Ig-like domain-containing protein [Sporosarcina sp. P19]PIC77109.1 hypothetical protein CSV74_07505 [Sporosarcina sp. P19]
MSRMKLIVPVFSIVMFILYITGASEAQAYGAFNHEQVTDAGEEHFMVLKEDGSVWAWGNNSFGQVGIGGTDTPSAVKKADGNRLLNIRAIAAGGKHSVALDESGHVWTWGNNEYGQLGHPATLVGPYPLKVTKADGKNLDHIVAIAAGTHHTLAVDKNGHVWAWGQNYYGQLGNPIGSETFLKHEVPVEIRGVDDVIAVAGGKEHSVALKRDGTVSAWGRNTFGQLGIGETADVNSSPQTIPGLSNIMEISAGDYHTLALKQDRTGVWAWGINDLGQLGNGGREMRLSPIQVEGMNHVSSISAGANHSAVIREDGSVWIWGRHTSGVQTVRTTPILVKGMKDAISIGSGGNSTDSYTLAVNVDGSVWRWDKKSSDSTTKLPVFEKVSGIEHVMKLDEYPFVQGNQVLFRYDGFASEVQLTGSFNNNIDLPLRQVSTNRWELQVELPPGEFHYGFRVNNEWTVDPLNREKTIDSFGRVFSVLRVAPYASETPLIDNKDVTFTYSSYDSIGKLELGAKTKSVAVTGNFGTNDYWTEIPMVKQRNNVWVLTKTLEPGDYNYSFIVRDDNSGVRTEKRNDPLNPNLQTDVLQGVTRNTFTIAEKVLTKIPITDITLNKGPDLEMMVGEQVQLMPRITPSNATNQNVIWTSSKPSIVSVVGGKLTAHSQGTATIIVNTVDGSGKLAVLTVEVKRQGPAISYPRVGYDTRDAKFDVEPTKPWFIKFGKEFDMTSVHSDNVYVLNELGVKMPIGFQSSRDGLTLEIRLLSGTVYERGAMYYLFVESTIKEKYGTATLKEPVQMRFQIKL